MPVRVLRVIEYIYDNVNVMERDMVNWIMNGPPTVCDMKMSSAIVSIRHADGDTDEMVEALANLEMASNEPEYLIKEITDMGDKPI